MDLVGGNTSVDFISKTADCTDLVYVDYVSTVRRHAWELMCLLTPCMRLVVWASSAAALAGVPAPGQAALLLMQAAGKAFLPVQVAWRRKSC